MTLRDLSKLARHDREHQRVDYMIAKYGADKEITTMDQARILLTEIPIKEVEIK